MMIKLILVGILLMLTFSCQVHAQQADENTSIDADYDQEEETINRVIELTDANLGSLTQIDGQSMTSGDWFVLFYAPWCSHCQSLHPKWAEAARELHGIVNVASIDAIDNELAAQRFAIKGFPTMIYLHHSGVMIEYRSNERSADALVAWALSIAESNSTEFFDGKPIPRPLTLSDRAVAYFTEWATMMERVIMQHTMVAISLIAFGMLLGVAFSAVIMLLTLQQPAPPQYKPIPQQVKKSQ